MLTLAKYNNNNLRQGKKKRKEKNKYWQWEKEKQKKERQTQINIINDKQTHSCIKVLHNLGNKMKWNVNQVF